MAACGCSNIEPGMMLLIQDLDATSPNYLSWINTGIYIVDITDNTTYCTITLSKYIDYTDYGPTWPENIKLQRYISDKIVGGWDIHNQCYTVSLQPTTVQNGCITETGYSTVNFDESINGWVSFYDYKPQIMFSLKSSFFSSDGFKLWKHYYDSPTDDSRGNFYGQGYKPSQIRFVFNPSVSIVKSFQTVSYEGSNGWEVMRYYSDPTEFNQDPYPINPPTNPLTYDS